MAKHLITQQEADKFKADFLEANKSKKPKVKLFIKGEKYTFDRKEIDEMLAENPGADLQIWHGMHEDGQYTPVLQTVGGTSRLQKGTCC